MSKLVSCVTCKHQVSSTAKFCPNCGERNPGAEATRLEIKKSSQGGYEPGCSLTIYSLLAGTLLLGLFQWVTGEDLGIIGFIFVVYFALFVNIFCRVYFTNKKSRKLY